MKFWSNQCFKSVDGAHYHSAFNYFILCVFWLYVYLCTMCLLCAHRSQKMALDPPKAGIVDNYELLCRCWETNLAPGWTGHWTSSPASNYYYFKKLLYLLFICVCVYTCVHINQKAVFKLVFSFHLVLGIKFKLRLLILVASSGLLPQFLNQI